MAGDLLTFTRSGQDMVVTAPDGASVRLMGSEVIASNDVLQPIDGLPVKPSSAQTRRRHSRRPTISLG